MCSLRRLLTGLSKIGSLSFIVLSAWQLTAHGGEVDAVAHMNQLLASKPPVQRTTPLICHIYFPGGTRTPYSCPKTEILSAQAMNSFVAEVEALTFEEAKLASLPELVLFTRKLLENCGDVTLTSSVNLSLTGTRSWSVAKANGVTTTRGGSVSGSLGVPNVGSASINLSWSQAITASTTQTDGLQESITRSMTDTVTVGPKKNVSVSLKAFQATIEIPYEARIIVDGDLISNDSGLQRASALLSLDERTLPINGVLRLTDVSEASVRTDDLLDASCEGTEGGLIVQENAQTTFPSEGQSSNLNLGFSEFTAAARSERGLKALQQNIDTFLGDTGVTFDGTIGPPDGTSYQILYTSEIARPAVACGFNDLGVPNTGIFTVEARQYYTYVSGSLVNQWQENVETFKSCWTA